MRKAIALVRVTPRTKMFAGVARALDVGTPGKRRIRRGGEGRGLGWGAYFVNLTCNGITENRTMSVLAILLCAVHHLWDL